MSADAQSKVIPLKLLLQRKKRGDSEIRRFRGEYNYSQLVTAIGEAWGTLPKSFVIAYQDPDGDHVRIGSQHEWEECLLLYRQSGRSDVLKLHVYRGPKEKKPKVEGPKKGSRRNHQQEVSQPGTVPAANSASDSSSDSDSDNSHEPEKGGCGHKESCPDQAASAIMNLLSRVFGSQFVDGLPRPDDIFGLLSDAFYDDANGELHVDLDRGSLRRNIVRQTNAMMDKHEYEAARSSLTAATMLFPDDALILYNLACAHALCGAVDDAYKALKASVAAGYDDVTHLLEDADLSCLHGAVEFDEIVTMCIAKKDQQAQRGNGNSHHGNARRSNDNDAPQAEQRRGEAPREGHEDNGWRRFCHGRGDRRRFWGSHTCDASEAQHSDSHVHGHHHHHGHGGDSRRHHGRHGGGMPQWLRCHLNRQGCGRQSGPSGQ